MKHRYNPFVAVMAIACGLGVFPRLASAAPEAAVDKQAKPGAGAPKEQPAKRTDATGKATPPPAKPSDAKPKVEPKPAAVEKPAKKDASIAFFGEGRIPRLKIQIAEPELQQLRQKNRDYVRCTVTEDGGKVYEHVGIHLKGAAGSFRGIDDKPALTLNFDKFKDGQDFHDLDKIHLNNSVQDASYLNEMISSEISLAAGLPAARVSHARVWLNGRDLGFYVLKEGFNKRFLKRHFGDPNGNLYEPQLGNDLNGNLELQSGTGVSDRSDIKRVIAACQQGDAAKRWQALSETVDINKFLTLVAVELMTCHWDGYANARNNYRIYFDPKTGKVHLFPHGMDQMFGDVNYGILGTPGSMLSQAVLSNPEWRALYRDRIGELIKLFVPAERLQKRLDEHHQRIRPVLAEMGGNHAQEFDNRVREFKERLSARAKSLTQQNAVVEARPLKFSPTGEVKLEKWEPQTETGDAKLQPADAKYKTPALSIAAGPGGRCIASWRTKIVLPAGKYRFEARGRTDGVKALADGSGAGLGIRLSGAGRSNKLEGATDWTPLVHEFQVGAPTQEVTLVAELRASAGQGYFETGSLKIVRVSK